MGSSEDSNLDKEIRVYFCPKCESTDVKYVFGIGNIFGVIPRQRCSGCGLETNAFPLLVTTKRNLETMARDSKKKVKKKSVKKKVAKKSIKKKKVSRGKKR